MWLSKLNLIILLGKVFNKGLDKDDQKEGLLKNVKNIGIKTRNQSVKQLIISKVKNRNFKNLSFRNLLDGNSIEFFNEINKQDETVDYSRLHFDGSSKKYTSSFKNFMSLGNLAVNIYNGNISLDAAKQQQRRMKNMLENFI